MYAIIKSGGKQYRVEKDDVIDLEILKKGQGDQVVFEDVLLFSDGTETTVGAPVVTNCSVTGELVDEVKGPKVIAFKYKRRKNYHRKVGHRQRYSRVKITGINRSS